MNSSACPSADLPQQLLDHLSENDQLCSVEQALFERILYRNTNQHRRGIYFHKLLELRRARRKLGSLHVSFGSELKESLSTYPYSRSLLAPTCQVAQCLVENVQAIHKCGCRLLGLLELRHFMPFSLTLFSIISRFYAWNVKEFALVSRLLNELHTQFPRDGQHLGLTSACWLQPTLSLRAAEGAPIQLSESSASETLNMVQQGEHKITSRRPPPIPGKGHVSNDTPHQTSPPPAASGSTVDEFDSFSLLSGISNPPSEQVVKQVRKASHQLSQLISSGSASVNSSLSSLVAGECSTSLRVSKKRKKGLSAAPSVTDSTVVAVSVVATERKETAPTISSTTTAAQLAGPLTDSIIRPPTVGNNGAGIAAVSLSSGMMTVVQKSKSQLPSPPASVASSSSSSSSVTPSRNSTDRKTAHPLVSPSPRNYSNPEAPRFPVLPVKTAPDSKLRAAISPLPSDPSVLAAPRPAIASLPQKPSVLSASASSASRDSHAARQRSAVSASSSGPQSSLASAAKGVASENRATPVAAPPPRSATLLTGTRPSPPHTLPAPIKKRVAKRRDDEDDDEFDQIFSKLGGPVKKRRK